MSFIIYLLFAALIGYWASRRGRNAILWAILAILISPLIAAIILAVLKDLSVERELEKHRRENGMLKERVAVSEANIHSRMDHIEQRMDHIEGKQDNRLTGDDPKELPEAERPQYCPQCGARISGDGQYCPHCGGKLF